MHGPVFPPHTYLDIATQNAPTYLKSMLDKYHAGYLVPDMRGAVDEIGPSGSVSLKNGYDCILGIMLTLSLASCARGPSRSNRRLWLAKHLRS